MSGRRSIARGARLGSWARKPIHKSTRLIMNQLQPATGRQPPTKRMHVHSNSHGDERTNMGMVELGAQECPCLFSFPFVCVFEHFLGQRRAAPILPPVQPHPPPPALLPCTARRATDERRRTRVHTRIRTSVCAGGCVAAADSRVFGAAPMMLHLLPAAIGSRTPDGRQARDGTTTGWTTATAATGASSYGTSRASLPSVPSASPFLPMHLTASTHATAHRFDPRASASPQIDVRAITAHIRWTMHALEAARRKFLIQCAVLLGGAIAALASYIYALCVTDTDADTEGAAAGPGDFSLLVFGCCSVVLLAYIASGTWVDRLHGKERYQRSLNRWLSLFGAQWQAVNGGEERLVLEDMPAEVTPSPSVHPRHRNARTGSGSASTWRTADITAEYEARKRSGIDSGWINQSPLASAIAASLAPPAATAVAHPPKSAATCAPSEEAKETDVSNVTITPCHPIDSHHTLSVSVPSEVTVTPPISVAGSPAVAPSRALTSPLTSPLISPHTSPRLTSASPARSRSASTLAALIHTPLSASNSPAHLHRTLTPVDARFLRSSIFSPDLAEEDARGLQLTADAIDDEPDGGMRADGKASGSARHPQTEMERVVKAIRRSKSIDVAQQLRQHMQPTQPTQQAQQQDSHTQSSAAQPRDRPTGTMTHN